MSSSRPEKTYRLAAPSQFRSSAESAEQNCRTGIFSAFGIDRWNQAADNEVIYTFRSAMSGAERNDATPVAFLYFR